MRPSTPAKPARASNALALAGTAFFAVTAIPTAHALWPLGNGELIVDVDASIASDSNIRGNSSELSDTIYTVGPSVEFLSNRGRGSLSITGGVDIERYADNKEFDAENYLLGLDLELPFAPAARLQGEISADYFKGQAVDPFLYDRVETERYGVSFDGSYRMSSKVALRAGGNYSFQDPTNRPSTTNKSASAGLGYLYRPEVSFFVDYRWSNSHTGSASTPATYTRNTTDAILVGLQGEITEKISGRLSAGYQMADTTTGTTDLDSDGLTSDISLIYAARPKTDITLVISRNYQVTTVADTIEAYNGTLALTQRFGVGYTFDTSIGYTISDYQILVRDDKVFIFTAGLTKAIGDHFNVGLDYRFSNSESDDPIGDFDRSVITLSGSLRY